MRGLQYYILSTKLTQQFKPSDAFQKREKANEDWAIRQREKEKLLALKAKVAEQQAHLKELADHMYVPRPPGHPTDLFVYACPAVC